MFRKCENKIRKSKVNKNFEDWIDAVLIRGPSLTPKKQKQKSPETSPRCSTPTPDAIHQMPDDENISYTKWRKSLQDTPKSLKVRGALFKDDEDFLSGQIVMKMHEKQKYIEENEVLMPTLNKCFLNLILNGPAPIIENEGDDVLCVPDCNCSNDLVKKKKHPIGHKIPDNNNLAVPFTKQNQESPDSLYVYFN